MIPALSLALILGGAVSTQTPWNTQLLSNQYSGALKTWTIAGTSPKAYHLSALGEEDFRLASLGEASADDVETVYRSLLPEKFAGKRIRISMQINTVKVAGGVGMWIRIDDRSGKPLVLKDMEHNLILGSTAPARYELQADVPENAARIGYGIALVGKGEVYFQRIDIEALDMSNPIESADTKRTNP